MKPLLLSLLLVLPAVGAKPNVLLIAIDDLNDWGSCLSGHPDTSAPNIDRLTERGVLFTNAHCQGRKNAPAKTAP